MTLVKHHQHKGQVKPKIVLSVGVASKRMEYDTEVEKNRISDTQVLGFSYKTSKNIKNIETLISLANPFNIVIKSELSFRCVDMTFQSHNRASHYVLGTSLFSLCPL
jgi:hypothetical protein